MANEEHLAILKQGVEAWNQWRKKNPDIWPDLGEADLSGANLSGANLSEANLGGANLGVVYLLDSDSGVVFVRGANLSGAHLNGAHLNRVNLGGANVESADVGYTIFGDVDLSEVKGLETVRHYGPSIVGIDTVYKSKGKISEVFLRGCGIPDQFISYIGSLVGQAIQYHSCFISYSVVSANILNSPPACRTSANARIQLG